MGKGAEMKWLKKLFHKHKPKFESYKSCDEPNCKDCVGFHIICTECGEELPMNISKNFKWISK